MEKIIPYYLVLLEPHSNHRAELEHSPAHVEFIDEMDAAGVVLLGGPFESPVENAAAAYVLHAESQTEAEAWVAKDPFIRHGVFRAKIVVWNLVGISTRAIDVAFELG